MPKKANVNMFMWITRTLTFAIFKHMNYVYVLKSSKDGELYIGSTANLKSG